MPRILRKILGFVLVIPFATVVGGALVMILMKSFLDVLLLFGSVVIILALFTLFACGMFLMTED